MIIPWIASCRVTSTRVLPRRFPVSGRSTTRFARHESTSPGTSPSRVLRSIGALWSEEEVQRLHEFMKIRRSKQEMEAAFPGRRQCAILSKWHRIRPRDQEGDVRHQGDAPYWSKEDERQLKSLLDDDTPLPELRKRFPNRTFCSITFKILRTKRTSSNQPKFNYKPWTSQDLEQLYHLRFVEKLTVENVAIKMGRTHLSVSGKLNKLRRVNLDLTKILAPAETKGKSP